MGIQQEQIQSSTEAAYQQEDNSRSSIWANLVCVVDSVNYSENTVECTPTTQDGSIVTGKQIGRAHV